MAWAGTAGVWPRPDGNQAHLLHLALNALAVDDQPLAPKLLA